MKRKITIALLLAGIVFCLAWSFRHQIFPTDFDSVAETKLLSRVEQYTTLRKADDWNALYEMVDRQQRRSIGKGRFLSLFGSGVMRMHGFETMSFEIDFVRRTATVLLEMDGELLVDRLPPKFRQSLRVPDATELRRKTEDSVDWVWVDGDWHFLLERSVLTGRDPEGKELSPVTKGN